MALVCANISRTKCVTVIEVNRPNRARPQTTRANQTQLMQGKNASRFGFSKKSTAIT